MSFPDNCIRGIPSENFLVDDETVGSHLFYFKMEDARDDGWVEQSINWEDDDSVIEFTLNQRKENGVIKFRVGVVIIPREGIDRLRKFPNVREKISYERQSLENNPYHGNILLRENVPRHTMRMIAGSLALAVARIEYQNQD